MRTGLRAVGRWLERVTRDRTWEPPSPSAWDEDGNAHAVWERETPPRSPWAVIVLFLFIGVVLVGWGAFWQWVGWPR